MGMLGHSCGRGVREWRWPSHVMHRLHMPRLVLGLAAPSPHRPPAVSPRQDLFYLFYPSWGFFSLLSPSQQAGFSILYAMFLVKKAGRGGRGCLWLWCLPSTFRQPLGALRPSSPGRGWTSARRWQVVNEFLLSLCEHAQLLLPLLNRPCLTHKSPHLPSVFSPSPGRGQWACGGRVSGHEQRSASCCCRPAQAAPSGSTWGSRWLLWQHPPGCLRSISVN